MKPDYILFNKRLISLENFKGKTVSDVDEVELLYSKKSVVKVVSSVIEHPTKPGYKRKDVLKLIKQLTK